MEISTQTNKSWRWNEDGSCNSKPCDPHYFKKYYHTNLRGKQFFCAYCCKFMAYPYKNRHFKTQVCIENRRKYENEKIVADNYSEFD